MRSIPVFAFFNNKGGVGKTTLTVNTAAALAANEKQVVVIDMDESTNLTTHLKMPKSKERSFHVSNLIAGTSDRMADCIIWQTQVENVALCPADTNLKAILNQTIAKEKSPDNCIARLNAALDQFEELNVEDRPDYIIIDLPPTMDTLAEIALSVATHIYFVADTSRFSEQGIINLQASSLYEKVKSRNPKIKEMGIVYNRLDPREGVSRGILTRESAANGIPVLKTYIPRRTEIDENSFTGDLALKKGKQTTLSEAFYDLAHHVIKNVSMDRSQQSGKEV